MYFNRYIPAARDCQSARAQMIYNAVSRFCGKAEPRAKDYVAYRREKLNLWEQIALLDMEEARLWELARQAEWAKITGTIRNAGQPLHNQHVVYFAIINNGLKCGEAKNLVQRHCNINRETPIQRMWYLPVENKTQALVAEHALHTIFDHAHCMNRQQNKKDYYQCDTEQAQKFVTANAHKIYQAVMEAIEGIK